MLLAEQLLQLAWNLRNQALKADIKWHPFYPAPGALREEVLLSDPSYRWGGKLQGHKSVCSQKKKKEAITDDKCFLLFSAPQTVPVRTQIENAAADGTQIRQPELRVEGIRARKIRSCSHRDK